MTENFENFVPEPEQNKAPAIVRIAAEIATSFTYASYQNAIPVVRTIGVENTTHHSIENLTLELTSTPGFLRPKVWRIDRLNPGDTLPLTDRRIDLDPGYLAGLSEAERGQISLRLIAQGRIIDELRIDVRLLARDEWGGVADMAQLLPAFVMPNDPGVASILRSAAERLEKHGQSGALDGYQSNSPQRAYMLTAAIYSAIAGMALHYAEPPASFEKRGQKVRRPGTVAQDRLATCLDTALLFAAALEGAGLFPVILLFDGHAAVGVWLTKKTFGAATEFDLMEVRKALASRELVVLETTGVARRPVMTMEAARQALDHRVVEEATVAFVAAIDVARSRSNGILPLASHDAGAREDDTGVSAPDVPLPAVPDFGEAPPEVVDLKPTTAASRVERWQSKLLDLTLRNKLLNFPDSKKSVPFVCSDVGALEDKLADGAAIRLMSLPDQNPLGERDEGIYRDIHRRDIQQQFAADALQRGELPSPLETKTLAARLIELHRQVRNDFAEGGANTLFLAAGFLRWRKKPEDARSYRAPLLLIPVKLERRSVSSHFSIRFHEDDPRFNATLLQFLQRDFDLKIPELAGELPRDKSGIDVPLVINLMRKAVRDVPGMEVVEETALSTFSFAKFLMWKDLVERTDALRQNRVVRHLIDSPEEPFLKDGEKPAFREERDLDRIYAPQDVVSLLPSDSSQTAASLAAAEGNDFVLVGPPGTGKSQTIANMIANCLAVGKTVLFVAEKTAALDVVHRRLRANGLGAHCIELHSSKTDRRHFLGQLKAAWEHGGRADPSEWVKINARLRLRRDELNAYVEALHKTYPNGWTPYLALGTALRAESALAPALSWTERDCHDLQAFGDLEEQAAEIGKVFAAVQRHPALELIEADDWSSGWQESLLYAAASLANAIDLRADAIGAFLASLGLEPQACSSRVDMSAMAQLARALLRTRGHDVAIAFDRDFSRCADALAELARAINSYREAERSLSGSYADESVPVIDVAVHERRWREAGDAFWPLSILRKATARRELKAIATAGTPEPAVDLPLLRRMQAELIAIEQNPLVGKQAPIRGLSTDLSAVANILELAGELRRGLAIPGLDQSEVRTLLRAVAPCLPAAEVDHGLRKAADRFLAAVEGVDTAAREFAKLSGHTSLASTDSNLVALRPQLQSMAEARHLLRDWAAWKRVRRRAVGVGLEPLVNLIEKGAIEPLDARDAFRLGYVRWWLPRIIDSDPILREFRRFQHENAIKDFREIDDLVRSHASRRVVSALAHGLPPVQSVPRNSELGLLRHQMELQRPSQSIRDMIGKMPQNFPKLAPCMLMSPLSIAQYLPANHALFDVAIFDEASQITTWDAVGAIARARQTIIVGDPKQLPPTNFFGRNDEEADEQIVEHEKDLESILDEARVAGIPTRDLRWHYRSRSESLIAFSNYHYYQNRLVTFPSPVVDDRAVRLRKTPNGVYDRGKSRTNRIEAEAVVREAVSRMKAWAKLPPEERLTLGVITFNAQQQSLILDLLDAARREDDDLEWFFSEERVEPTIVKNLENVQGDERDVMLFSITFWKDSAGKLTMDFGALNRDGGERRLNVAVTRARRELIVFSGFTADKIDATRARGVGTQHLKTFLDYAERGAIALPAQDGGSQGGFDSPFEQAVAEQLELRNWRVMPQVGVSGFRIDLGIHHPDLAGAYLAGVECDGATYHRSATARDRDKVREEVLTGLGWNILRVWSTDWWFDARGCADRLHAGLEALLQQSRAHRAQEEAPPEGIVDGDIAEATIATEASAEPEGSATDSSPQTPSGISGNLIRAAAPSARVREATPSPAVTDRPRYRVADLSAFPADPDQFFEFAYRGVLRAMIEAVVEAESPLRADVLAQRIARAHGWLRTGARIRERIDLHLRGLDTTMESSGLFVWKARTKAEILTYREPADADSRRSIADIPLAELASVVLENPEVLDEADPARDVARILGVERLAAASRDRLEEAIARARSHHAAPSSRE